MKTLRLRLALAEHSFAGLSAGDLERDVMRDLERDPALQQAAAILRGGGLVAFPTETVYGLGANALDAGAVEKIFAAKQRPHWDPVIVHIADVASAQKLAESWPESAARLAEAFWPGPLTMLLPRKSVVPDLCTAGLARVGLRLPSHPVARALISAAGVPVAAPSANRFGHTSPTTAEHVLADLDGRIDAVLDGGSCAIGVESTVLDPTSDPPLIYRPGGVSAEQIRAVLGDVAIAQRTISDEAPAEALQSPGLQSPGLGIRHYAPRARLLLVTTAAELSEVVERESRSHRVGVLLPEEWALPATEASIPVKVAPWGSWREPETLARELYRQLRSLDDAGVEIIVCPLPPVEGIGAAIADRLRKAAR